MLRVRALFTGLLVISLALPLATRTSCSYIDASGHQVDRIPPGADSTQYRHPQRPIYAWSQWPADRTATAIAMLAYLWPVGFLAYRLRRTGTQVPRLASGLEAVCGGLAAYWLWASGSLLQDLAPGGYLAVAANGVLAALGLGGLLARSRPRAARAPN